MPLKCPACGEAMSEVQSGLCEVDLCRKCGGVWFDHQELRRVLDETPRALVALDSPAPGWTRPAAACPRCGGELRDFEFAGIAGLIGDRCQACRGIWLDGGELRELRGRLPHLRSGVPAGSALDPSLPTQRCGRPSAAEEGTGFGSAIADAVAFEVVCEVLWGVVSVAFSCLTDS